MSEKKNPNKAIAPIVNLLKKVEAEKGDGKVVSEKEKDATTKKKRASTWPKRKKAIEAKANQKYRIVNTDTWLFRRLRKRVVTFRELQRWNVGSVWALINRGMIVPIKDEPTNK
jgi:hypothetical protein